mmetsp:Transcript_516/g.582  ORF Transcript_516/g.582 Transcript_516/m.582 type:complete len:287 (+) Transcript_516:101-961(+)|eukprot:CAMPEP_0197846862 /NCGR_PEP_ID=MMETSP1438-20131217/4665_1 /TAXON_ID=1461541 /ORGANISM="Pterosperma sp., Strain CCMP1384" /LENGTH=286 /DNA_ID=CAMNT_0043458639 /DNA_START=96 /DNA_END=956 /DNA_ORIENTATION=+
MSLASYLSRSAGLAARACKSNTVLAAVARSDTLAASTVLRRSLNAKTDVFSQSPAASVVFRSFQGLHSSPVALDKEESTVETEVSSEGEAPEKAPEEQPRPEYNRQPRPAEPSKKLYVANLAWSITEADLRPLFEPFGPVDSVELLMNDNGQSRGMGYVIYENTNDAMTAVEEMNQHVLEERPMRVQYHQARHKRSTYEKRPSQTPHHRLYVGNMPWAFDEYDMRDMFSQYGSVVDAKVMTDRETGRSRGFGFVTFSEDEDVDSLIAQLNGALCDGRSIVVNRAER